MHLYILYLYVYNPLVETISPPPNLFVMKTPFSLSNIRYRVQPKCPAGPGQVPWTPRGVSGFRVLIVLPGNNDYGGPKE